MPLTVMTPWSATLRLSASGRSSATHDRTTARGASGGLTHAAKTAPRQLEGDPRPAAALHAVRRRGCRLPPHGGYAPGPRIVQPAADPATALDDRGTPAMQRTIEVEACVRGLGTRGAAHDRGHLRARRNLPQGDRSPLEGHARCAQDLATVLLHPMS